MMNKERNINFYNVFIEFYKFSVTDVEDFRRIIGKLDIDYAAGLLDNPGGEEGENLLRSYLRSKLSGDEYARGKELFFLYNYILLN